MTPTVALEGVTKSLDGVVAVDQLSLSIPAGQIFGWLGPNGAGKTSTIRMMIGITIPDAGSLRLFGQPLSRKLLERVGYLPEERGLYRRMGVSDNLRFLGELKGISRADALAASRRIAARLDVGDWLTRKIEELSKGTQQKVQFIAALLGNPEFVIMDEPFFRTRSDCYQRAERHPRRTQERGPHDSFFDASDGSGREALRLDLPHQSRPCCS